jgi:L-fucono-1,5-lactonase
MTGRLDAHMHVWRMARGDYDWLTRDLGVIYRDFTVDDVWPDVTEAGVSRTLLVQAAATAAETDFLLSIAASDDRVAGVVGWTDFEAPSAVAEVARLAGTPHIVGLRPMIADLPDPRWILREDFTPVLEAMAHHGLVLDGHARHDLVPVMTELAARHPGLQIVLNHGGKPQIAAQTLGQWRDDIARLAENSNVACKLSGLLTEAGAHMDDASIGEVVEHLGACFGPERLLWGSDWPVLTLAGTYAGWAAQSERLIRRLFPDHQEMIWGGNAERIYFRNGGQ